LFLINPSGGADIEVARRNGRKDKTGEKIIAASRKRVNSAEQCAEILEIKSQRTFDLPMGLQLTKDSLIHG